MTTHNPNDPQNPFNQQRPIPGVKNIIAIASGKGGVGKSTVAANLALALSKKYKVGLVDTDIYGPSVPRLFGTLNQKVEITPEGRLQPIVRYGIKLMSLGYIVEESAALIWRGPMLFKAIEQLLRDVNWGDLDFLIVDLPPGTGDVQLSLVQKTPIQGAIIVSTPQNMALGDAKKAIDMFQRVQVPILGYVENMSYMINPANYERLQLFPKGEIESYMKSKHIKHLGDIPFHPNVSLSSEAGVPIVEGQPQSAEAKAFFEIAEAIRNQQSLNL